VGDGCKSALGYQPATDPLSGTNPHHCRSLNLSAGDDDYIYILKSLIKIHIYLRPSTVLSSLKNMYHQ
jgi:hypothetical protein